MAWNRRVLASPTTSLECASVNDEARTNKVERRQAYLFPQGSLAKEDKAPTLLFKAASETMLTIAAGPKHLGAKVGITAVLHTSGSAMTHHPHVHMIVTGGGISNVSAGLNLP